ncbi:MAG TPA: HAD-IA family hydrolase [Gemmatimonadaceae bacterium]|nr:HAD-IA family hydrolase [Gemmatimonadaceae bacterium]
MKEIHHIFFDIGGVLGSNGWDREQRQAAVERFKLDADDFQWRHEDLIGEWEEGRITLDEYLDIAVFHTKRDFSRSEFIRFMLDQSVPNPETVAIARELAGMSRFHMMTLNNESEELNAYRIIEFGLHPIFSAFISSCYLSVRKPFRRFYNRALGIAQCEPSRSLFIDDRQQNLTPAQSMGMNVILFKSAPQLRADLEQFLDLRLSGA